MISLKYSPLKIYDFIGEKKFDSLITDLSIG